MALVLFESRVNMITVATPSSVGGVVVGYDETLGVLTQKDHFGVITPIGSGSGIGSLAQTLSIGRTTGTNSIFLDTNTLVRSSIGSGSLRLDNGSSGNYVQLSSSATGSTLTMNDNTIQITGLSSSVQMDTTDIRLNFGVNQFLLQNNNSYLKLGSTNVLEFTTATGVRANGNRVPAFISSNASRFSNTVTNSVIVGGTGIIGTQSNSVYVPNLIVKDGGYVKGTIGDGQLEFNSSNETYLTSIGNIIGILNSKNQLVTDYSGIFITDTDYTFTTKNENNNITFISSSRATVDSEGLTNTVVIGGQDLIIDSADTVYLGGAVDINNQYKLPTSDGTSGQFISTDGSGNLTWSSGAGSVIPVITVNAVVFSELPTFEPSSTYRIINADTSLYGGTEIYLTTNSQGVLNDEGEGKFYNPRYDQTVDGYKIWAGTSSSYATNSVVYWGGRAWRNNNGTNTLAPISIFSLNLIQWTQEPVTNGLYYSISYDKIKYDRLLDKIIYRNERGTNIVNTNAQNIIYWADRLYNPIKAFQWGNVYGITGKGIGNQDIINSYNENINFRGIQQTNITMNNLSSQYNLNTGTSSVQDNLIFNNYSYNRQATLLGSESNMSFQSGVIVTIDGDLRVGTRGVDSNDRFTVSSSGGTVSLIVDENGYVYNRGRGGTATNTAFGFMTLGRNTTGNRNTAFGASALSINTSGSLNTVLGNQALMSNLTGASNIAIGHQSLNQNISGSFNIAVGANSLRYNRASSNTAIGSNSLTFNTTGNGNVAVGHNTLSNNTTTINTFGTITPGSGYVPGTYSNVQLIYATGSAAVSYPRADIIVDGSGVVTSVTPGTTLGSGFIDTSTRMTISNSFLGGTGSGFEVATGTLLTGNGNTAIGLQSLTFNTTGNSNTALGDSSLDANTTGNQNTAIGSNSLTFNTTGNGNVAVGRSAMLLNTTGSENTVVGWQALARNTTSDAICAFGRNVLFYSKTGTENCGLGNAALYYNTLGSNNTGIGSEAGFYNTTGVASLGTFSGGNGYTPGTYSGVQLRYSSGTSLDGVLTDYPLATIVVGSTGSITSVTLETTGQVFQNTSTIMTSTATEIGPGSGFSVQIGSIQTANNNTAIGYHSLHFNTIGSNNTALGFDAGSYTTSYGTNSISDNSVFIGYNTRANLSNETNQIVIGYEANGNGSNTVTLGNDSIVTTYLKGDVQTNGTMTATGFFNSSDIRLKEIIERNGDTVKFTWKDKRDDKVHIGYIAQEVQEKYPDQVNKSTDGMLTVNYIEVLVAKIQELENRIKQLEK
jgi:hypothetical protein